MNTLLSILCLALSALVQAREVVVLHMPDAPPLTIPSGPQQYGLVGDLVMEAIDLAGYQPKVETQPWARGQLTAATGQDLLITPLSRTPEREAHYTWIAPVMHMERAFFSVHQPVASFAEARQAYQRIGIGQGTAQEQILLREGFSPAQFVHLKLGSRPVQMLQKGRIDAWFTTVAEGHYLWPKDEQMRMLMSPPLASTDIYLACSLDCNPELVKRMRGALMRLERNAVGKRAP